MEKENDPYEKYLGNYVYDMNTVRPLIQERDQTFRDGKKQIESLKTAKVPEPNLKLSGGPQYKNANYRKQKDEAVVNLRDKYQKLNDRINEKVFVEVRENGAKEDLKAIKEKGIQYFLDKGIHLKKSELATNKEIRRYIREQGFDPDKTKDQDKPMDREPKEKIPDPVKSEPKSKEARSMEKNKKDMGMDRDR